MAEKGADVALREAEAQIKSESPTTIAERTGACCGDGSVQIDYFKRSFTVDLSSCSFDPDDLSMMERLLVIHYLTSPGAPGETVRQGAGRRGALVGYRSLQNGMFYYGPFRSRTVERLLPVFGNEPEKLLKSADVLNGTTGSYGDASVRFEPFPMIDACIVLHLGDDELDPEMTFLFNQNVVDFLSLEDIALLGGIITSKLIKRARTFSGGF